MRFEGKGTGTCFGARGHIDYRAGAVEDLYQRIADCAVPAGYDENFALLGGDLCFCEGGFGREPLVEQIAC